MGTVTRMLSRLRAARRSGEVAEVCRRHAVHLMVLFGSAVAVRGDGEEPGDLDLAVAFRPGTQGDLLALVDELAELLDGDQIDVMDLASAGPVAAHRALTRGELVYEAEPHLFAERQIFAVNHYIETAPLRTALLESLTR